MFSNADKLFFAVRLQKLVFARYYPQSVTQDRPVYFDTYSIG